MAERDDTTEKMTQLIYSPVQFWGDVSFNQTRLLIICPVRAGLPMEQRNSDNGVD
jgi:hypothetical protein